MKGLAFFVSICFVIALVPLGLYPSSCCPPHPSPSPSTPSISNWAACYEGNYEDCFYDMLRLADGTYIAVGRYGLGAANSQTEAFLVHLDSLGNIITQKALCGVRYDLFVAIKQFSDGTFALSGYTQQNSTIDALVVRLDSSLNIIWQTAIGIDVDEENPFDMILTSDEKILVVGQTPSARRQLDGFAAMIDKTGNVLWCKAYGDSGWDVFESVVEHGENYLIAGASEGSGSNTPYDFWLVCIDPSGNVIWERNYATTQFDYAKEVVVAPNGDIIVLGHSKGIGIGGVDVVVFRVDGIGQLVSQIALGKSGDDACIGATTDKDSNAIIIGSMKIQSEDIWVTSISRTGLVNFSVTYGQGVNDLGYTIANISDTALGMVGFFASNPSKAFAAVTDTQGLFDGTAPTSFCSIIAPTVVQTNLQVISRSHAAISLSFVQYDPQMTWITTSATLERLYP